MSLTCIPFEFHYLVDLMVLGAGLVAGIGIAVLFAGQAGRKPFRGAMK